MMTTDYNQQQGSSVSASQQSNHLTQKEQPFASSHEQWQQQFANSKLAPYRLDLSKELVEPEPILTIGGYCIASVGNISTIVGEAKSKKTFLASALIGSMLAFNNNRAQPIELIGRSLLQRVVWFDTEQSELHVRRVAERINRMTGFRPTEGYPEDPRISFYALREVEPKERVAMLVEALELLQPSIVVIDGIADLQRNTNDLEESDRLVGQLMALSTLYNCHIISILHTNPGTDKARGHLGSSLQRKSETVLYVHRAGNASIVEPQFCRNEPFERFAFEVDPSGLPARCAIPTDTTGETEVVRIVREEYGGTIDRSVLLNRLAQQGLNDKAAAMRIHRAIKSGYLTEQDRQLTVVTRVTE